MNTVETAYQAWADYMDDAPLADVFTDAYHNTLMGLWLVYVDALSNGTAVKAYSDLVTLKTPTIASETEIDPTPASTHKRYFGTFHMRGGFAYVHAKELLNELNVTTVCGMTPPQVPQGALVEFSANASFNHALRVVVVDNAVSEAAYERMKNLPQEPTLAVNPKSRIIRETLYQKAQRLEREAKQREQARANPHQTHVTTEARVTFGNEAGYTMDGPASDYDTIEPTF